MQNNSDLDDSAGWQPLVTLNSGPSVCTYHPLNPGDITTISSGFVLPLEELMPKNTLVIGPDNMCQGGDYCFIIGSKNVIPYGATNCGIIGCNVQLTHDNVLKDAIYFGSCKQNFFISKSNDWFGVLDKIENLLKPLLSKSASNSSNNGNNSNTNDSSNTNNSTEELQPETGVTPRIMLGRETDDGKEEFIDLKAKIEELEEKLNMLLYAPGGPLYQDAEKSFNTIAETHFQ
jgi:hypothetical protein